jgi:ABC-type glutathione transport system ATPase component
MGTEQAVRRATQPALMRASGLKKTYAQRAPFSRKSFTVEALAGLDLELAPSTLTALVGESGSGKSTLARCLAMMEKPDCGEIWFEGKEVSHADGRELAALRPRIQMVFQDSAQALNPRFNAVEIIAEPLEIQRREGVNPRTRASELMEEMGLSPAWADRRPLELSGGQRQRLAIARAIALQPAFLILDESLSGLDLSTQTHILNLLLDLQERHSLTYLLISHDLGLVGQIADFVAVMHRGRIIEHGTREQVFGTPQNPYTRDLLLSARLVEPALRAARAGAGL